MSTKYEDPKLVPTSVLIERLKELADAIAKGNRDELTMRIPAEVDRDADIVLAESARRLGLLRGLARENDALDEARAESKCNYGVGCGYICARCLCVQDRASMSNTKCKHTDKFVPACKNCKCKVFLT